MTQAIQPKNNIHIVTNSDVASFLQVGKHFEIALSWIEKRYPEFKGAIRNYPLKVMIGTYHNSDYTGVGIDNPIPIINIKVGTLLVLYNRKSVTLTTPEQGLNVTVHISLMCAYIHELTHHIQFLQGRRYSEVETTMNEINYLKEFHPEVISKLIKPY